MGIRIGGNSTPASYGDDGDVGDAGDVGEVDASSSAEEAAPPPPEVQELQNDGFVPQAQTPMAWADQSDAAAPEVSADSGLASFKLPQGISYEPDFGGVSEGAAPAEAAEAAEAPEAAEKPEAHEGGEEQMPLGLKVLEASSWVPDSTVGLADGGIAIGGKLAGAAEAGMDAIKGEAEIANLVDEALSPAGSVVAADVAAARTAAAATAAEETFGDALKVGQTTERVAEGVKGFLESPLTKAAGAGLGAVAGAVVEYHDSTAQTVGGKAADAGLNAVSQTALTLAGGAVTIADAGLNLTTKYLLGKDGEAVNKAAGGFIGGNLATAGRAITSLGEAVITGETAGIEKFNEKSLKGEYGYIFQKASELGNSDVVRNAGADAIEATVDGAKAVGRATSNAANAVADAARSTANRAYQKLTNLFF